MGNVRRIHDFRLSPPQKHLCIVGTAGEKEKESARGTIHTPRAFYFSIIAIFTGIPSGIPSGILCGGESDFRIKKETGAEIFPQLFLDFTIGRRDGSEIVASKMNLRSFGLYQDYSNSL